MFYGAPAAGILCVELLKQCHTIIPWRSKSIQNLTIFTAFLAWVPPSAPNVDLCRAIKSIISRVLDQVLGAPDETDDADNAEVINSWYFDIPLWDDAGSMDDLGTRNYSCPPWLAP